MDRDPKLGSSGMVLGKFMPPHKGHEFLINFAREFVENLTVIVGSLESEPIPGKLRYNWVRQLFPDLKILHLSDENPQEPSEHPDFWQIWHDSIRKLIPKGPDYLFASEDYGPKLADILDATFIPGNVERSLIPVSASQIRENPYRHWNYLPECVRPFYAKRVCIFGPESTGKTTLAKDLAKHYKTVYAPEFARELLEFKDGQCSYDDITLIGRGQIATEEALLPQANKVIFCDTDLLTTTIWSKALFSKCPKWLSELAEKRRYDLYLLTDIDAPYVEDKVRYLPQQREEFMRSCEQALFTKKLPYVKLTGSWQKRFDQACKEVNKMFA